MNHVDQTMTAFRVALARMDANPTEAARIRLLANLTDDGADGEGATDGEPAAEPRRADPRELVAMLGVPLSLQSLECALTHRSYAYENGNLPTNERLEFLGDSVLGLVVTDTLFRGYPDLPEGQLARRRAAVVQMSALAGVARSLNLGAYVRLGRGE